MDIDFTPEQEALETEVYNYLKANVPPELEEDIEAYPEGNGPVCRQLVRKLGNDGWMGIGWPGEYGGQGRTPIEQYIFFDLALGYFGVHLPLLSLMTVGPTLMKLGTEEQRRKYLPGILTGEVTFAIAYTEPEAGTDLFSLKTSAVRDGDDYVINGQKIFTTYAHICDYFWLAARTDPHAAKKHEGISIFLVDAKSPGVTIEPMPLMGDYRVNQEFFDNVRVPKDCLVGEENQGVEYMIMQLAHERISMVPHSLPLRRIHDVAGWARTNSLNGAAVIDQAWVKNKFAEMIVETEVLKLLNHKVAWMLMQGVTPHVESAMVKVFGSEQIDRVLAGCLQIMGLYGQLWTGSKWAPLRGTIQRNCEISLQTTFAGGTNEVLRDIIAMIGLGMMKSR